MGVKRDLNIFEVKEALNHQIEFKQIIQSTFGATDTVYFLDDKYVLKLYEKCSLNQIKNEILLHKKLNCLKISTLVSNEIFYIQDKPCLLFEKSKGRVLSEVKNTHLKQIASFLKQFHSSSKNIQISNEDIFSKTFLENQIKKSRDKRFKTIYDDLDLDLKNDTLIHGDLFVDNTLFIDDVLDCVIDFNEVCIADYLFELAVVIISWCKFDNNFKTQAKFFLENYDEDLELIDLKNYMIYACLYYAVFREVSNRDYAELLSKIEFLKENF